MPDAASRARDGGFTLIEIMAVVTIFALLVGLIAPRVGSLTSRSLRNDAEQLAAQLELARQRAVVTGIPHRLMLDLESAGYWLEWELSEEEEEEGSAPATPFAARAPGVPLDLTPPRETERVWQPVPGMMGDFRQLAEELSFAGLETSEGWVDRGDAWIEFARDGTASTTSIHMDDESGSTLVLDVRPLVGGVAISDASI